jgi:hypothetical protein
VCLQSEQIFPLSLIAALRSLFSEKKFPVPVRREFRRNQLIYGAENKA